MLKSHRLLCAAACLLPVACTTPGGGPFGIVMFDPDQHVSSAEPLWGKNDLRCLDNPTFLLALLSNKDISQQNWPAVCRQMAVSIRDTLPAMPAQDLNSPPRYTALQRNEIIDAMMSASDRKCSRYIAFLQQYDGNVNSTFGIAAQSAAIIASMVSGGTAQAFAAGAGIAGGVRGTLNESHFNNQTIGVLANAFENVRREQREKIAEFEAKDVKDYTLMRGIQDATRYHGSCSIVVGLKEAQRDVEAARSPNIDTMKSMVDKLNELRAGMKKFVDETEPVPAAPPPADPIRNGTTDADPQDPAPPIPG